MTDTPSVQSHKPEQCHVMKGSAPTSPNTNTCTYRVTTANQETIPGWRGPGRTAGRHSPMAYGTFIRPIPRRPKKTPRKLCALRGKRAQGDRRLHSSREHWHQGQTPGCKSSSIIGSGVMIPPHTYGQVDSLLCASVSSPVGVANKSPYS